MLHVTYSRTCDFCYLTISSKVEMQITNGTPYTLPQGTCTFLNHDLCSICYREAREVLMKRNTNKELSNELK